MLTSPYLVWCSRFTVPFSSDGCDVGGMPRAVLKKTTWGVGQQPQALWPRPHVSKPGWWPVLPKVLRRCNANYRRAWRYDSSAGILLALNGGWGASRNSFKKETRGADWGTAILKCHGGHSRFVPQGSSVGANCWREFDPVFDLILWCELLLSCDRVRWI